MASLLEYCESALTNCQCRGRGGGNQRSRGHLKIGEVDCSTGLVVSLDTILPVHFLVPVLVAGARVRLDLLT